MKGRKYNQFKTIILSGILGAVFLMFFHGSILKNPNDILFASSGDGIKNYYTYAYHIEHDSSYIHFEGMNYPYGELHQFTDGQPFLAGVVKTIDKVFPGISYYSIGILNFMILVSLLIAAVFIALILMEFNLPVLLSAVSSVVILSLAPQIHRFGGHLSLSYFFAFPVLWYILIRFYKRHSWGLSITAFIINLILLFTHPYLSVINSSFIIAYYIFTLLLTGREERPKRLVLHVFLQAVLPIILWLIFIAIFDFHPDRPQLTFTKGGTAVLHEILLPNLGGLNNYLKDIVPYNMRWESWAYIGTISLLILLFLVGRMMGGLIMRRKFDFFPAFVPHQLKVSFLASVVVLLYSLGVPYRTGFWFILDWIPALQQIRTVARFAWVFYYVINVLSIVVLYHYLVKSNFNKIAGYVLLTIALLAIFSEGKIYHNFYGKRIDKTPNYFQKNADTELNKEIEGVLNKVESSLYQAILPLPYYHVGSGVYGQGKIDKKGFAETLMFSYQSGLPLISVNLSRTSLPETKALTRITAPPFIDKPVLQNFDERPVLVLVTNEKMIRESERWIIEKAEKVTANKLFSLYSIKPSQLSGDNNSKSLFNLLDIDSGQIMDLDLSGGVPNGFFHKYFKEGEVNHPLDTSDAVRKKMAGMNLIFEKPAKAFDKSKEYEISFWYHNKNPQAMYNHMLIVQKKENGKAKWTNNLNVSKGLHLDEWSLITLKIQLEKDTEILQVFLNGKKKSENYMYFSDFLIREEGKNIYGLINDSTLFYNNFRIPLEQ